MDFRSGGWLIGGRPTGLLICGDHLFLNCIFFLGRRRLINNGLLINPDLTLVMLVYQRVAMLCHNLWDVFSLNAELRIDFWASIWDYAWRCMEIQLKESSQQRHLKMMILGDLNRFEITSISGLKGVWWNCEILSLYPYPIPALRD